MRQPFGPLKNDSWEGPAHTLPTEQCAGAEGELLRLIRRIHFSVGIIALAAVIWLIKELVLPMLRIVY